jgi:membrane protein DedA with SNARE-associated domain
LSPFLITLIEQGGLLATVVLMALESAGFPISSEIVVPVGGALAATGHLPLAGVIAAATLGNLIGSLAAFVLVKRYGLAFINGPGRRLGLTKGHIALAYRLFDRWGGPTVFIGRLLPVVRTYISFPAGLSRMRIVRFSVLTVLGAIPWNAALAYAGYLLGQRWEQVARALSPFTIPAAALVLLLLAAAWYFGRRLGDEEVTPDEIDKAQRIS